MSAFFSKFVGRVLLTGICFYRRCISAIKPPSCRFQPSCSVYAGRAVKRFGPWRGMALILRRLLRCHPFSGKCGYDPVPQSGEETVTPRVANPGTR